MTDSIQTPGTATRIAVLFAAIMLCLMGFFGVSSAQAHDELISSVPATGEVLDSAPKSVVLTFSGDIKKIGTVLVLSNAQGSEIGTTFEINRREVAVTPEETLANGKYTLAVRVVSSDGHPIEKEIDFDIKTPAAESSLAPSASSPAESSATAAAPATSVAPSAEPSAQPGTETENSSTTVAGMPAGLVWTIIGVAGVGIIVLVLLKVRRQTK